MNEKTCSKCGLLKPLEGFYPDNAGIGYKLGVSAWCKECHRANRNARYRQSRVLVRRTSQPAHRK